MRCVFFFFNDTATTEIYTLSLHDALPILPRGKWVGYDVPDFGATKAPDAQPKPDGIALDALSGTQPFIMRADGRGWLFVPAGLVDGPLPTHYEPHEAPIPNPL